MSEPGPTWAVETIKRVANGQRRDMRLWGLANAILHQANALVHQAEEPPPGFDQAFDMSQVMDRVAEICRLCGEIIAGAAVIIEPKEEDHARGD